MRRRCSFSMVIVLSPFLPIIMALGVLLVELAVDAICICCYGEYAEHCMGEKIEFHIGKGCNCIFPYPLIQSKVLLSASMRNRWIPNSLEVELQTAALERKCRI